MGGDLPEIPGYDGFELVGQGGQAKVFKAREARLDRVVAVKVLSGDDLGEPARRRFREEGTALVRMGMHPNIVTIFDVGETAAGRPYLAMEYCPHGSLSDRLKREGPLPVVDVVAIGSAIAAALDAVHGRNVLHRDVKPGNILRAEYGIKLADFGIARDDSRSHTTTAQPNTPAYAAPELFDDRPPSRASDVWSLGATLYALLDGHPPYHRDNPSLMTLASRKSRDPLPAIDSPHGVPPAVEEIIRWALHRDPALRPASAGALARQLAEVGVPIEAPPAEPRPARPPVQPVHDTHEPETAGARWEPPAPEVRAGPVRRSAPAVAGVRRPTAEPVQPAPAGARVADATPGPERRPAGTPVPAVRPEPARPRLVERERSAPVQVRAEAEADRTARAPVVITAGGRALSLSVEDGEVRCAADGAELAVLVGNGGAHHEDVRLEVDGVPAGWTTVDPSRSLHLAPGRKVPVRLLFRPPPGAAGTRTVEVAVASAADPNVRCSTCVDLVLARIPLRAWLEPSAAAGTRSAAFVLCVRNDGAELLRAAVAGRPADPDGLDVRCGSDTVDARPWSVSRIPVTVTPRQRLLTGAQRAHPFAVEVEAGDAHVEARAQFTQLPRLAAGDSHG